MNSEDPDEMPHLAAFHVGNHCSYKYPFRCFHYTESLSVDYRTDRRTNNARISL